jgi:hypothetical protein
MCEISYTVRYYYFVLLPKILPNREGYQCSSIFKYHKIDKNRNIEGDLKYVAMNSRNDFIASVPVYLRLTERTHLRITVMVSCALSPIMLSLVETFLEHLLWKSFQCHHHIFLSSVS